MPDLTYLLEKNRVWAGHALKHNPDFFTRLLHQQTPRYLWIGCADSRVPANQIVDLDPGELFVHRNVANVVIQTDLNCLSVIQYAVDVLKVEDIIVCGHYGCGGVEAALRGSRLGLIDNWLWHIRDIYYKKRCEIDALEPAAQVRRLCELNATEQAVNVSKTTVVRNAWERGQKLAIHAWVYSLQDGLIRDLGVGIDNPDEAQRLINP